MSELRKLGTYLEQTAVYLRNVRQHSGLCQTCAAPIDAHYDQCIQCDRHSQSGYPIADRVGSMVYASKANDQTYVSMYGYKAQHPPAAHTRLVRSLLRIGVVGHTDCLSRLASNPVQKWAYVPSSSSRDREHPLRTHLLEILPEESELSITVAGDAHSFRQLRPENFAVLDGEVERRHVLLIDDSWVSGGHAQSAAGALKIAGASEVSILTLSRVLDPARWPPAENYIKDVLSSAQYDYLVCPWTRGPCP